MSVSESEVNAAIKALRSLEPPPARHYLAAMLEAQQATILRLIDLANIRRIIVRRSEIEIDLLRRVVRAADYVIGGGAIPDSRYDEARKALIDFDKKR